MYGFEPHPIIPNLPSYNQKKQRIQQKKSSAWWNFVISLGIIGGIFIASTGIGALVEFSLGAGLLATLSTDLTMGIGFSVFSYVKGDRSPSSYILNFVFPIADGVFAISARLYKTTRLANIFNSLSQIEPFIQTSAKEELARELYKISSSVRRGEISEDFINQYKYAFRHIEQKYNIKFINDFYDYAINFEIKSTKYGATQLAYRAMMTADRAEKNALALMFLENPVYKTLQAEGQAFKINTFFNTFSDTQLSLIAKTEVRLINKSYQKIIHILAKTDRVLMYLDPFYAIRLVLKKILFKRWVMLGFQRSIKEWIWDTKSLSKLKSYTNDIQKNLSDKFYRKNLLRKNQNFHPFNDSEWIDGIEIRPVLPNFLPETSNIEAQIVDIVVYFKRPLISKWTWKEPVVIYKLFYIRDVLPFLSATSKGQYYLKNFAWGWRIGKMLSFFKKFEGVNVFFGKNAFDLAIEAKWLYMDADTVYNLYFKNHFKKLKKQFGKADKEVERQLIWSFFWLLNLRYLGSPVAGLITENKNMFRQRFLSRIRSKSKILTYKRTRHFSLRNNRNHIVSNKKKRKFI